MKNLIDPARPFPEKIAENIWVLGNYYFNLFLIKGEKSSALVEMGVSAVVDDVIGQLEDLDITPDYLIMTHPHADHLTGLPGLKERFPDAIWVSAEGASDFITHPKALQNFVDDDLFIHNAMHRLGYSPGRAPIRRVSPVEPHLVVSEKRSIDLGGFHLDCIQTWGHSPGSLMVHVPHCHAVFASDSLGFHFNGRCFLPLYFTGYDAFLSTLIRIKSLKPAIIGLGHQSPFTGEIAGTALDMACRAAPALDLKIRTDQRSDDELIEDLFSENYRDEFTIYTRENIRNCCRLLVKRSRQP